MKFKEIYKQFVFLYIRETPNDKETREISDKFKNFDGIIGDLNLDPAMENENRKIKTLCGNSKVMSLKEITTINFRQLDHILIDKDLNENVYATSYNNFASDHRSIVFRIGKEFTADFLQYINFDSEHHLKVKVCQQSGNENPSHVINETPRKQIKTNKFVKSEALQNQYGSKEQEINLHNLNPEEWLDETIINEYCKLLSKQFKNQIQQWITI